MKTLSLLLTFSSRVEYFFTLFYVSVIMPLSAHRFFFLFSKDFSLLTLFCLASPFYFAFSSILTWFWHGRTFSLRHMSREICPVSVFPFGPGSISYLSGQSRRDSGGCRFCLLLAVTPFCAKMLRG